MTPHLTSSPHLKQPLPPALLPPLPPPLGLSGMPSSLLLSWCLASRSASPRSQAGTSWPASSMMVTSSGAFLQSRLSHRLIDSPRFPARPVRPILGARSGVGEHSQRAYLCTYSSMSLGKS